MCVSGGDGVLGVVVGGVRVRFGLCVCYTLHNSSAFCERLFQVSTHLPPFRTLRELWMTFQDEVIVASPTLVFEAV